MGDGIMSCASIFMVYSVVIPQPEKFMSRRGLLSLAKMRAWRSVLEVAETAMARSPRGADQQFDIIICIFLALRKLRKSRELQDMIHNLGT